MKLTDPVTEFFYNVVPSILFILVSALIAGYRFQTTGQDLFLIFIMIVLGIFIGFFFQGLTKFFRDKTGLDDQIWKEVVEEDPICWGKVLKIFKKNGSVKEGTETEREKHKRIFYLMHNFLLAKGFDKQATFFTDRTAFWFNIFFGVLFLFPLSILMVPIRACRGDFKKIETCWLVILIIGLFMGLFILLKYSWWLSRRYLKQRHDVVLKTYVLVEQRDEGKSNKKTERFFEKIVKD